MSRPIASLQPERPTAHTERMPESPLYLTVTTDLTSLILVLFIIGIMIALAKVETQAMAYSFQIQNSASAGRSAILGVAPHSALPPVPTGCS